MTSTLHVYPWAARPLSTSAALTRPWVPVSGFDPGPHWARGTGAGSAPRAGPELTPAKTRTDTMAMLHNRRTDEPSSSPADVPAMMHTSREEGAVANPRDDLV